MPSSQVKTTPKEKLDILLQWFKDHEIEIDQDLIEIKPNVRGTGDGFGIVAKKDLPLGEAVGRIHKKALLSSKTCGIADLIEEANLMGSLALTVAVMYEKALQTKSPWCGYLQSLPTQVDLPMFWNKEDQAYLSGTDLGDALTRDLVLLKEDYETSVVALVKQHPVIFKDIKDKFTFDDFLYATSLVTSRSFHVDMYHGDCMVPFSDIFNHKTGGNHVRLEGEGDVCPECGSAYGCLCYFTDDEHNNASDDEWDTEDEDAEDGDIVEEEDGQEEDHHHDNDGGCDRGHSNDDDSCPSELDDMDMSDDEDGAEILEMAIVESCKAGEEVFNTYGEHSNTSLLHRYGFIEENNENNSILVTMNELQDVLQENVSLSKIQKRSQVWVDFIRPLVRKWVIEKMAEVEGEESHDGGHGCQDGCCHSDTEEDEELDDEDDDVEDFRFESDGTPCLTLLAYLSTIFMSDPLLQRIRNDPDVGKRFIESLLSQTWKVSGGDDNDSSTINSTSKSPVSQAVARTLISVLMNRLARYPTSRDQDEADATSSSVSSRARTALRLRLQEREMISKALEYLYDFQ